MTDPMTASFVRRVERLNEIGIALSSQRDHVRLVEQILLGAKDITRADGGTIYAVTESGELRFEILRNDSLKLAMGGTSGTPIPFPPVKLRNADGSANTGSVVAQAVLQRSTINIPDAYAVQGFDFSGARSFDTRTGYRSTSFLTVPMLNHENEITGVLQLINARDVAGRVVPFGEADQRFAESLASQAAIAITNHKLISGMKELFESFVKLIATAIDEKAPYTGGHCRRVPELTMMLAEAAHRADSGPLADFRMSEADRYELHIAGWLHDCGKVTTPEWVMDKATKLQTIHDRISEVATRFTCCVRALELERARGAIDDATFASGRAAILDDLAFVRRHNTGGEFMKPEDQQRVREIAKRTWTDLGGESRPVLSDEEVKNLLVSKGTLTDDERKVINHHIVATIRMLESLPYPKHLKRVPEFAGGHHERMDGKGYPKGLKRDEMSVQARVMAIADVFEALTAGDRPYKKAFTLSQALGILGKMRLDNHIDPDLFDVFIREKVWLEYAKRFLPTSQIDEVDLAKVPGFSG